MKVYIVYYHWTDPGGWFSGGGHDQEAFLSEDEARQYMFKETGDEKALKYGWAESGVDNRTKWYIREMEIQSFARKED